MSLIIVAIVAAFILSTKKSTPIEDPRAAGMRAAAAASSAAAAAAGMSKSADLDRRMLNAYNNTPVLAAGVDYVVTDWGNPGSVQPVVGQVKPQPGDFIQYLEDDGTKGIRVLLTATNLAAQWNAATPGDYLQRSGQSYRISEHKTVI